MKIDKQSHGGTTTIRLIGDFQSEHLEELEQQFKGCVRDVVADLKEVTLVDVDVVRFLVKCKARGVTLRHCAPYIRAWMDREQTSVE